MSSVTRKYITKTRIRTDERSFEAMAIVVTVVTKKVTFTVCQKASKYEKYQLCPQLRSEAVAMRPGSKDRRIDGSSLSTVLYRTSNES